MSITSTIDPGYFELMPTLVVWNRFLGEDQWGNNQYADDVAMRVRMEPVSVSVNVTLTGTGTAVSELALTIRIICDLTDPRIAPLDKITVVEEETVLEVTTTVLQYDEHGPYYQELQCKQSEEPE